MSRKFTQGMLDAALKGLEDHIIGKYYKPSVAIWKIFRGDIRASNLIEFYDYRNLPEKYQRVGYMGDHEWGIIVDGKSHIVKKEIISLNQDPKFIGCDLSNLDFGDHDMRDIELTNCDLSGSNLSRVKNLNPKCIFACKTSNTVFPEYFSENIESNNKRR